MGRPPHQGPPLSDRGAKAANSPVSHRHLGQLRQRRGKPSAEVTVDQFIKSLRVKVKDPGLRDQLESVTRAIFDVLDINKDGVLGRRTNTLN